MLRFMRYFSLAGWIVESHPRDLLDVYLQNWEFCPIRSRSSKMSFSIRSCFALAHPCAKLAAKDAIEPDLENFAEYAPISVSTW